MAQDSWEIHILTEFQTDIRQDTGHCTCISLSTGAHLTYGSYFVTLYCKLNRNGYMKRDSTSKNFKEQKYKAEDVKSSHYYMCQRA